ncbi:MAG: hypothetical protein H7175_01785, partial [Burkholderiales bacterium]|nr:hypothetical protein [Anaerolineae bacterium]
LVIVILSVAAVASADPATDGCYLSASASTINEDGTVTITAQCDNIATINNVFGFQLSSTRAGDLDATVLASGYTSANTAGGFYHSSTGMSTSVIEGANALSGLYAATRRNAETVSTDDFAIGSYVVTADDDLTVDGSITITFVDGSFMLSNNIGQAITGDVLRSVNDLTITVTDIDLAWFTGNMIVRSDVTAITEASSVELNLGSRTYSATDVASYTNTFNMDATYQYGEGGSPASDGTLNIAVTADMSGHLACSTTPVNLGDTGSAIDVDTKVGTTGTIMLKAGDTNDDGAIDITDATAIGANIGVAPSDEKDVNGDNAINVLDLVHVGRNYTSTTTSCGTGS